MPQNRPVLAPPNPVFRGSEKEAVFIKEIRSSYEQVIPEISFWAVSGR